MGLSYKCTAEQLKKAAIPLLHYTISAHLEPFFWPFHLAENTRLQKNCSLAQATTATHALKENNE